MIKSTGLLISFKLPIYLNFIGKCEARFFLSEFCAEINSKIKMDIFHPTMLIFISLTELTQFFL